MLTNSKTNRSQAISHSICLLTVVIALSNTVRVGTPNTVRVGTPKASAKNTAPKVSQLAERVITKVNHTNEPYEIIGMFVGKKQVRFDETFIVEDNWLKDFRIQLKNVSEKIVHSVILEAKIPRKHINLPNFLVPLKFGAVTMVQGVQPTVWVKPGETIELKTQDNPGMYDAIKQKLHNDAPGFTVNKISLEVTYVMFDDDTVWRAGVILNRDKNNPKRFNVTPRTSKNFSNGSVNKISRLTPSLSNFAPSLNSFDNYGMLSISKAVYTKPVRACGQFTGFSYDLCFYTLPICCLAVSEDIDESGVGPWDIEVALTTCLECAFVGYPCYFFTETVTRLINC